MVSPEVLRHLDWVIVVDPVEIILLYSILLLRLDLRKALENCIMEHNVRNVGKLLG